MPGVAHRPLAIGVLEVVAEDHGVPAFRPGAQDEVDNVPQKVVRGDVGRPHGGVVAGAAPVFAATQLQLPMLVDLADGEGQGCETVAGRWLTKDPHARDRGQGDRRHRPMVRGGALVGAGAPPWGRANRPQHVEAHVHVLLEVVRRRIAHTSEQAVEHDALKWPGPVLSDVGGAHVCGQGLQPGGRVVLGVVLADANELVAPLPAKLQDGFQRRLQDGKECIMRAAAAQWLSSSRPSPSTCGFGLGAAPAATGLAQVAMTRMPRSREATPHGSATHSRPCGGESWRRPRPCTRAGCGGAAPSPQAEAVRSQTSPVDAEPPEARARHPSEVGWADKHRLHTEGIGRHLKRLGAHLHVLVEEGEAVGLEGDAKLASNSRPRSPWWPAPWAMREKSWHGGAAHQTTMASAFGSASSTRSASRGESRAKSPRCCLLDDLPRDRQVRAPEVAVDDVGGGPHPVEHEQQDDVSPPRAVGGEARAFGEGPVGFRSRRVGPGPVLSLTPLALPLALALSALLLGLAAAA